MLNTKDYKDKIVDLYKQGIKPQDIAIKLNFKYNQPVYNLLHKLGLFKRKETNYIRKYNVDETFFENINSEEKAYIFGFICADAHVDFKRNCINITVSTKDIDILYKIKNSLKSEHPIVTFKRNNPYLKTDNKILSMSSIQINSKKLTNQLNCLGIENNKTYTLNESVIKNIEENCIRHFLRGYFDGDGNVMFGRKYNSGLKYNINICGNENFLLNTYQKYFPSYNKMYFEKKSKQMYIWKLSSKENVIRFLDYLYKDSTIYLNRKYKIYEHAHLKSIELLET